MPIISSIAACLPSREILNKDFEDQFSTRQITGVEKMVGVKSRRWANEGQSTVDLCIAAARALPGEVALDNIDLLIVALQTPTKVLPAAAFEIHGRLGLSADCACMTLSAGCTGFTDSLALAFDLLVVRNQSRALVLVGDTLSKVLDKDDRATAMIFGDAAGAALVEHNGALNTDRYVAAAGTRSDGYKAISLDWPSKDFEPKLYMKGMDVFNFTVDVASIAMEKMASLWSEKYGPIEKFDNYLIHQANNMVTAKFREKMNIDAGKMPSNLELFGNTSGSTIPLLICSEHALGSLDSNKRIMLLGFGVGLAWSAVAFDVAEDLKTAIVEL